MMFQISKKHYILVDVIIVIINKRVKAQMATWHLPLYDV